MSNADPLGKTVLSGSFSFGRPALLCARAHLYDDRLELTGWRLTGRYRQCIPLRHILQADVPSTNCLLLWMADGQTLRLRLKNARRWQQAIARRLEQA